MPYLFFHALVALHHVLLAVLIMTDLLTPLVVLLFCFTDYFTNKSTTYAVDLYCTVPPYYSSYSYPVAWLTVSLYRPVPLPFVSRCYGTYLPPR